MKLLFITPHDINDLGGNGGVKCSRRNFELLNNIPNAKVYTCILGKKEYVEDEISDVQIDQPEGHVGELVTAICGYKRIYPTDVCKLRRFVKREKIDVVWIDASLIGKLTKLNTICKVVVFFHNCEYDFSINKVKHEGIQFLPAAFASKVNEKCAMRADKVICLNRRDSDRLLELYGRQADYYLPVTFEDSFDESKVQRKTDKVLLFVGSFFKPNIDSVEWFMENVMKELPEYKLVIVGKGFESCKIQYESKYNNVRVVGGVNDISEFYYSYPVMVMPILYGAGMKVKTVEAMMYGEIIIASDEALEGYEVEGVSGIYRCNSKDEYIETIKMIFDNKIDNYQYDVRKLFMSHYKTSLLNSVIDKCVKSLTE